MASNESSKIKLVLIGKLPIKNSDKMMKIWVNPNNVTHIKSVIRPVLWQILQWIRNYRS